MGCIFILLDDRVIGNLVAALQLAKQIAQFASRVWNVLFNPRPPITGPVQYQAPIPISNPPFYAHHSKPRRSIRGPMLIIIRRLIIKILMITIMLITIINNNNNKILNGKASESAGSQKFI